MTTTVRDNFTHQVNEEVIRLSALNLYLDFLWRDMSQMMGSAESMDLPEWGNALSVENTHDTAANARTPLSMTVQTLQDAKRLLRVDQARGLAVELNDWMEKFTSFGGGGAQYVSEIALEMVTTLKNDRDSRDVAYLTNIGAFQTGANPATHVNPAGASLTRIMARTALARMMSQRGVNKGSLAWVFSPFGLANVESFPEWVSNSEPVPELGLSRVGSLFGVPVYESQGVQVGRSVDFTASERLGNELIFTLPEGHGYVQGMVVTSSGPAINAANAPVTQVDATTVRVADAGADAPGNGPGTLVEATPTAHNLLVNRRRLWKSDRDYTTRLRETGADKTTDAIQSFQKYGRVCREGHEGTVIVLHSAADTIDVA